MSDSQNEAAIERSRQAWISALRAHFRAAKRHAEAAAFHGTAPGHLERRQAELDRLAAEKSEFDAAVALHPEWAEDVPAWPDSRS